MSFGQFMSVLFARWKVMLAVLVFVVGVTIGISLALPSQYTATATVVVDAKSPDPIAGLVYPGLMAPGYMATQLDIVQSQRVARQVVRTLRLTESAETRQKWVDDTEGKGDFESWIADLLQKKLDVKPSRESNVINISYKAADPRFAALIANTYAQSYIGTNIDLRVEPAKQYSTFFDARSKLLRDEVEKSQAKLSAAQKAKGITGSDERFDVETARLNDLAGQMVAVEGLSAESGSRQSQARGKSSDQMQDVLMSPLISSLKIELSRQEANLQQLSSRFGDSHPDVRQAKASIAELRTRLDSEMRKITGGVGVSDTINRQREAQIRTAFDQQRTKVLKLKEDRDELMVLQREVENNQRTYEAVLARLNQTSLESQTTLTNVSILNSATEPSEPSSPRIVLNSIVSLFVGALLALGTALVLELRNRKVRSVDDVVRGLGLPVLGFIPAPDRKRLFGNKRRLLAANRPMGQLSNSYSKGN